jgi:dTDP-4-dehydrorhamnose reductase
MSKRPVILITGSDGQLGFELQRALAMLGEVVATNRSTCDLAQPDSIRRCVQSVKPDVIVNAGAYTAVDRAETERELAFSINATAPQVLAAEAKKLGAKLIHYSTDYVFDGCKASAYLESDATNPLSVYGESKLAGEQAVQAAAGDFWIFRTTWVFGLHGDNFLKAMLRLAQQRETLSIVADQYGAPTSAALIADVTALLVRHLISSSNDKSSILQPGIYHLAAGGETNWHAYAQHVIGRAQARGLTTKAERTVIVAIGTADYPTSARRPQNSRVDCTRLEQALNIQLPDWKTAVNQTVDLIMEQRAA